MPANATSNTVEEFVISREFDAPRDLVWKAWTENERMAQWFGPKGVTIVKSENDPRPGGTYHYAMRMPTGDVIWGRWVYREIAPPERLVFVSSFSDPEGGITRHPGAEMWPRELLSTITFEERRGKTTVTVRWMPINATAEEIATFESGRKSMIGGWTGTFEQLEQYLDEAGREIAATRVFDAPRELVWKVWTDPKHVTHWYGPNGFSITTMEMDVRPGGRWEFIMHGPDGTDYPNEISYVEVVEPERLAYDHLTDPFFHVTVTFTARGNQTEVAMRSLFKSAEARDHVIEKYGAVEGMHQTLSRLGEYLATNP